MLNAAANTLPSNGGSYSSDKLSNTGEDGLATDAAVSGGFFLSDYKKHDDLKQMLDSNKDGLKLEAMKRIIGMVAKGRDASDLFPAVVKNVVSKNIEVKKLVYVYLVRYAEDQQDLALLSISTFQRALKDPNQLIRASALRVLSSIRVTMIVPIVMLAIKDSANDMSPYVRKTAAHAIPKLYSLDPEQKEELVNVLEKLLSDKTTLVVGSAVMAFEEVCPERIDLIHKNYRKLCNLLVDVDEWGQVIIVTMLTRYARTQFVDPNIDLEVDEEFQNYYDEDEEFRIYYEEDSDANTAKKSRLLLDADHRLLLRNAKPLLQSRNASVVMAVAQLYHHAAPSTEVMIAAKALIRLLRSHREVQSIVLHCIASMSVTRKGMFEPFLKSFFVRTSDPTHIKLLKLNILTNLATDTSISIVLREFQTYISSSDKEFVGASIQAIGRCASNIKEVTDICLNGLVCLLSNRDEAIVAESVVVIKKLLQTQPNEHKNIITHMAKLMDFITVPQARASILWLLGEYSDRVPKIAPDVLRKMAKTFVNEKDIVKLQTLNLAVKLYLSDMEQTTAYCQYIFQLAKYDQNYDIRDRVRFLRYFVFESKSKGAKKLAHFSRRIFLTPKPAPTLTSIFMESRFQLGTLSHYLDTPCVGYKALMPFPKTAPDPTVRDVSEPANSYSTKNVRYHVKKDKSHKKNKKDQYLYSDNESTLVEDSDQQETSNNMSSESSDESDSSSSSYSSTSSSSSVEFVDDKKSDSSRSEKNTNRQYKRSSSDSEEEDYDSEESNSNANESDDPELAKAREKETKLKKNSAKEPVKNNLDLLLELDNVMPITPVMTPSLGGFLSPLQPMASSEIREVSASFVPINSKELLNKITGYGLKVEYRFTRLQHLINSAMVNIELIFNNGSNSTITNIHVGNKNLPSGIVIHDFVEISQLDPNVTLSSTLGINFNDSTQPITFNIDFNVNEEKKSCSVNLKAPIGEIIRSVLFTETVFVSEKEKLKGMNEHTAKTSFNKNWKSLADKVLEAANVAVISNENNIVRFAAQTLSSKSLVLITVTKIDDTNVEITVNCEKMIIGSMLLNELKSNLH